MAADSKHRNLHIFTNRNKMGNCINKQEISDESSISSIEEISSEKNFKSKKSNRLNYFNMHMNGVN